MEQLALVEGFEYDVNMTTLKADRIGWETAGLSVGEGHPKLGTDVLLVPNRVELSAGRLSWGASVSYREVEVHEELLLRFAGLAGAPVDKVLKFARKWGVLGLCRHGLPSTHFLPPSGFSLPHAGDVGRAGRPGRWCDPRGVESVEAWDTWADRFRALLNIAASLYAGRPCGSKAWLSFFDRSELEDRGYYLLERDVKDLKPREVGDALSDDKLLLQEVVNHYLDIGGVRPRLILTTGVLDDGPPRIGFGCLPPHRLFGVLAIQLMTSISRTGGPMLCSSCGSPYSPRRRPKQGQRHYCEACGRRAAVRDAQRDRRRRRREMRREEQDGETGTE
jgi:hypothetical protein